MENIVSNSYSNSYSYSYSNSYSNSNSKDNELKTRLEYKSRATECTSSDCSSDDDEISTTSSDDALCDVLGLSSLSGMGMVEEEREAEREIIPTPKQAIPTPSPHRIDFPSARGVSRKYFPSEECFAYEIPHILTSDECIELIKVAANSSRNVTEHNNKSQNDNNTVPSSFRYITHAVHTAPDGQTKFQVKLERPNPHKLAVFRHESWVKLLWERIEPLFHAVGNAEPPPLKSAVDNFIQREGLSSSTSISSPIAGLNPRIRVLKYDACDKDEFQGHFDATTEIHSLGQTSYLTILLYLNDGGGKDFDGGETEFLSQDGNDNQEKPNNDFSVKIAPRAGSVVLFEHDLFHRGRPLLCGTKYVLRTDVMFLDSHKQQYADTTTNKVTTTPLQSSSTSTNGDSESATLLLTVEDVLSRLEDKGSNTQEMKNVKANTTETVLELLRKALSEGLGFGEDLHDTTIECLCSPGRFALNLILREYMQEDHHQRLIDRFLNTSFEALANKRK